jgi:nucleoid DNA-binding protein
MWASFAASKPARGPAKASGTVLQFCAIFGKERQMAKATAISDPMNKTQILSEIADNTGLSKKEVGAVFDELTTLIERHIKKRGAGTFTMPGLFKVTTTKKKAVPARKGINPFTGEEQMFKAKPARTVIKVRPLKKMKDMV